MRRATALAGLVVFGLLASACADVPAQQVTATVTSSVAAEGTVDLRVYLRAGKGSDGHLVAVSRRVPITDELPLRALESLIAGPLVEDGPDLRAPLPQSTKVQAFRVEDAVAIVDLSAEVIRDAERVNPTPQNELLALAAVANTLTEFPVIDQVQLTVNGKAHKFWGGWGLPQRFGRDETVIGAPVSGSGVPELDQFTKITKTVGHDGAPPVTITGVRTIDRIGFVRVVVELSEGDGDLPAAVVPVSTASVSSGQLQLEINSVRASTAEPAAGQRIELDLAPFTALAAEQGAAPGSVRYVLYPGGRAFWLHTLTSPTRVVLDVRK